MDAATVADVELFADYYEAAGPAEAAEAFDHLGREAKAVAANYVQMRRDGTAPKLALMFACKQPPGAETDSTFLRGRMDGNQFADGKANQQMGDELRKVAEAHGQNVKGKTYIGSLAAFPGDPEAWVDGKADIERVCRKRGWRASGAVTVHQPEAITPSPKKPMPFRQFLKNKGVV